MDRLKREGNPPVGQLASPVPQYKDVLLDDWAELQGEGGASYVKDRDAIAKLEQVRALLSGVATEDKLEQARTLLQSLAGKDFATQATLAQVKSELEAVKAELQAVKTNQTSGDQKVQLSGPIVVKQEVVLARGIYTESTGRKILNKPPEARGLHLFCRVHGRTGTFGDGEGISLICVFNRGNLTPGVTSYGFQVVTDRSTSNYVGHHIFIGPDFVGLGDARGEFANVKVSPMVLTTTLNFELRISGTFEAGEGFDTDVTAVWVR